VYTNDTHKQGITTIEICLSAYGLYWLIAMCLLLEYQLNTLHEGNHNYSWNLQDRTVAKQKYYINHPTNDQICSEETNYFVKCIPLIPHSTYNSKNYMAVMVLCCTIFCTLRSSCSHASLQWYCWCHEWCHHGHQEWGKNKMVVI